MTSAVEPVYFLLVDDLEENLFALEALLRREGLVLLKARSGVEALEYLLQEEVALAIVDVQMPGMDGFELAELMRGSERTRRVPIIFLTAGASDWNRRFRGYEAGAVDFLQKPIEADVIKSKAEVFFELFKQRQEVAHQRDELKTASEEIKRLLKESLMYAQALRDADQRKDDFLAMLAHELRNPLAPVRNAVEILRLPGVTEVEIAQTREIIFRQVTHMVRLVDDLLDVARIARGKIALRIERCDLGAIVRQTTEDYRQTLADAGVTLKLNVAAAPMWASGDPIRIAQIFGNLLHNAAKFTPRGGLVEISAWPDVQTSQAVIFVRDTGVGLDEAVLQNLFEPFSQADQKLDRDKGGLGLGLALVKGLVELHSGSVVAESDGVGKGSKFTLRIPLEPDSIGKLEKLASDSSQDEECRLRILLVEDNRDAAITLKMLLTLMGHDVCVAHDGPEGLALALSVLPEVVISDLGLPGAIDGYSLANALRAEPNLSDVYLIALSGYGQDDDRRKTEGAGFHRHFVKPVEPESLKDALNDFVLQRRRAKVQRPMASVSETNGDQPHQ
ncbi:response regulator [Schlesneria sp.]|uniref:response regulator n=1 Tax=Schlesneria sp. TaxID=2762018 RepID=UPI002F20263E